MITSSVVKRIQTLEEIAMANTPVIDDTNDDVTEDIAEDYTPKFDM